MAKNKAKMNKFLTGAITATMVATAVAPTAALAAEADFSDVPTDSSHYPNIVKAAERGLMTGYADGTFKPTLTMNRGQVVKALGKYLVGQEGVTVDQYIEKHDLVNKVAAFEDVPATHADKELFKYSLIVKDAKAFTGNNNNLHPTNDITRQQMAKVLVNAFNLKAVADSDVEVADMDTVFGEYKGYVEILAQNEVTKADDGKFRPAESVTRQQMASFLNRSYTVIHGEDDGGEDVDPAELNVKAVTAITATQVTVEIDAPAEDLVDQTVVVKDGVGKIYAVNVATIKADATTATFNFTTPLTVNPTEQWTVNGVAYKASEFAIAGVESVDVKGKYINVQFNQKVTELDASEISVRNKITQRAYGVESVKIAADGYSALVTMIGNDSTDNVLEAGVKYTLSITKNAKVTTGEFVIPAVIEDQTVTSVDPANRTIKIGGVDIVVPKTVAFDFQEALGRDLTVWLDEEREVAKFNYSEEVVEYDAVKVEKEQDDKTYVTILSSGKKYQIDETAALVTYNNQTSNYNNLASALASTNKIANSAKVVIDRSGKVQSIIANNFTNQILVEKVNGTYVISQNNEVNLKDYQIVRDGKTITTADLKADEVVFYHTGSNKIAEVFTNKVTGTISNFYDGEFKLNDKIYKYDAQDRVLVDGEWEELTDQSIAPFTKEVNVYTDRTGNLVFLTGNQADVVSNTTVGFATKGAQGYKVGTTSTLEFTTQNLAGEVEAHKVDLSKLSKVTIAGTTYTTGNFAKNPAETGFEKVEGFLFEDTVTGAADNNFELKFIPKDGTAATSENILSYTGVEGKTENRFTSGHTNIANLITVDSVVEVTKDADGNIIGLNIKDVLNGDLSTSNATSTLNSVTTGVKTNTDAELTDTIVKAAGASFKISANTPVFIDYDKVTGDANSKENVVSTTWGKLPVTKVTQGFKVFADPKDPTVAAYIVVDAKEHLSDVSSTTEIEGVLKSTRTKDNDLVEATFLVNGEEQVFTKFSAASEAVILDAEIGQVIDLTVNKANLAEVSSAALDVLNEEKFVFDFENEDDAKIVSTTKQAIVSGSTEYKLESNAKIYEVVKTTTGTEIKTVESLSDLAALAKAGKELTISTIAKGNTRVDTVIVADKPEIVFSSSTNVNTANDVATLGLTGATVASSEEAVATAEIEAGKIKITSNGAGDAVITVTDSASNTATIDVTVAANGDITIGAITPYVAPDTTAPVITANDETVAVANLAAWTETVTATDDVDGTITGNVVATYFESDGSTQLSDLAAAKSYIDDATSNTSFVIKYNVDDAAGNSAVEVVVTITVTP